MSKCCTYDSRYDTQAPFTELIGQAISWPAAYFILSMVKTNNSKVHTLEPEQF